MSPMKARPSRALAIFLAGFAAPALRAEEAKPVALDLVVQDKKGVPIKDLKPEEIEVTEAGLKRPVTALKLVEGAQGSKTSRYVTLVFDGLDAEGQKSARKAAAEFLAKLTASPDIQVAVFRVGLELWVLSGYTSDPAALNAAVERATSHEDETLRGPSDLVKTAAAREMGVPETAARARALVEVMRVGDDMNKMRQDGSTLFPLIALAKGQATLPGRKTLVYFSQWFDVPSKFDDVFRSLISEANRAGVALYTIDARGVRSGGDLGAARSAMEQLESVSRDATRDPQNPQSARANFNVSENVAASTRQDMRVWLGQLSESTGAVLVGGSNDLRKGTQGGGEGEPPGGQGAEPRRLLRAPPQRRRTDRPGLRDPHAERPGGAHPVAGRGGARRDLPLRRRRGRPRAAHAARGPHERLAVRGRREGEDLQPALRPHGPGQGREG